MLSPLACPNSGPGSCLAPDTFRLVPRSYSCTTREVRTTLEKVRSTTPCSRLILTRPVIWGISCIPTIAQNMVSSRRSTGLFHPLSRLAHQTESLWTEPSGPRQPLSSPKLTGWSSFWSSVSPQTTLHPASSDTAFGRLRPCFWR